MFKKIALTGAALSVLAVSSLAGVSTADAGYHHGPHFKHHVFFKPHHYAPRPHYYAPRPHYVTYGCHYKKQLVDTAWGYKWQVVKVCPGHRPW